MSTRLRRPERYRVHELAFDRTDRGTSPSCSCGWPAAGRPYPDEGDAHYAGAEHLGRMAYRRLALRGVLPIDDRALRPDTIDAAELWSALAGRRHLLGDEARAVLDIVTECWPHRTGSGGGRC